MLKHKIDHHNWWGERETLAMETHSCLHGMLVAHIFKLTIYPKLDLYRKELDNNPKIQTKFSGSPFFPSTLLLGH